MLTELNPEEKQVQYQVLDQVLDQVLNQVWAEVRNRVMIQVRRDIVVQVCYPGLDHAWGQVSDQIKEDI